MIDDATEDRVQLLESILLDLGHKDYGDRKPYCWCDCAIGDPQQPDHTAVCKRVRALDLMPTTEDIE